MLCLEFTTGVICWDHYAVILDCEYALSPGTKHTGHGDGLLRHVARLNKYKKKKHVLFFLCLFLYLFHFCYAYRTSVNHALGFQVSRHTHQPNICGNFYSAATFSALQTFSLSAFCLLWKHYINRATLYKFKCNIHELKYLQYLHWLQVTKNWEQNILEWQTDNMLIFCCISSSLY